MTRILFLNMEQFRRCLSEPQLSFCAYASVSAPSYLSKQRHLPKALPWLRRPVLLRPVLWSCFQNLICSFCLSFSSLLFAATEPTQVRTTKSAPLLTLGSSIDFKTHLLIHIPICAGSLPRSTMYQSVQFPSVSHLSFQNAQIWPKSQEAFAFFVVTEKIQNCFLFLLGKGSMAICFATNMTSTARYQPHSSLQAVNAMAFHHCCEVILGGFHQRFHQLCTRPSGTWMKLWNSLHASNCISWISYAKLLYDIHTYESTSKKNTWKIQRKILPHVVVFFFTHGTVNKTSGLHYWKIYKTVAQTLLILCMLICFILMLYC